MASHSRIGALALTGFLAGCAAAQQGPTARPVSADPLANMTATVSPEGACRQRRTRVQNCLVEAISTSCRSGSQSDDDRFYSCMAGGLAVPATSENHQYRVTVGAGEEAFSFRSQGNTVIDVGRLEATAVDGSGVAFVFEIERLALFQPQTRQAVEHQELRMNFDGSKSGAWDMVAVTEVYHMAVEQAGSGRAAVTFETANPRVVVRSQ